MITARSAAAARYDAYLCDAFSSLTFREFLSYSSIRACGVPRDDGYGYVRRAYSVDPKIGSRVRLKNEGPGTDGREGVICYPGASTAHVHVALDGEKRISHVHPYSIEFLDALAAPGTARETRS